MECKFTTQNHSSSSVVIRLICTYILLSQSKQTPAIIPPSGSSNGVIRVSSSRWPLVTKAIKQHKQKPGKAAWEITAKDSCEAGKNLGLAPLDPSVFELIYQVTMLSGLWGELSRMVTITVRPQTIFVSAVITDDQAGLILVVLLSTLLRATVPAQERIIVA